MNISPLQEERLKYEPKLPGMLRHGISEISVKEGEATESVADQDKIKAFSEQQRLCDLPKWPSIGRPARSIRGSPNFSFIYTTRPHLRSDIARGNPGTAERAVNLIPRGIC